jgi:hypothetical protein
LQVLSRKQLDDSHTGSEHLDSLTPIITTLGAAIIRSMQLAQSCECTWAVINGAAEASNAFAVIFKHEWCVVSVHDRRFDLVTDQFSGCATCSKHYLSLCIPSCQKSSFIVLLTAAHRYHLAAQTLHQAVSKLKLLDWSKQTASRKVVLGKLLQSSLQSCHHECILEDLKTAKSGVHF